MIFSAIPIVGHVVGGLLFLAGDIEGGNRAIYEATRSTAVMAGGALGAVGGPVGIAAGAVAAGMVTDLFASVATDYPAGVLEGVIDIATDIANGELPVEATLKLSLCVVGDVVGGIGGATIANATKEVGKVIGKDVGKKVIEIVTKTTSTHAFARAFSPKSSKSHRNTSNQAHNTSQKKKKDSKMSSSDAVTSSGSGSDPPEDEQNKIKKVHYEETDTHWEAFLKIFSVTSLDDICMGRYSTHLFKNLDDGQRRSLYKLISQLRRHGCTYFVNVIEIVKQFFHRSGEKEVTFQNFISIVQFVTTFVGEKVAQRNDELRRDSDGSVKPFKERQRELMDEITTAIVENDSEIYYGTFFDLQMKVWFRMYFISPSFRNDLSAVYHYFKHRFIPDRTEELSIDEYFDLIQLALGNLKTLPQFGEMSLSRRELVYEKFMKKFERRIKSSCYFLTVQIAGDKDGDEFIDGKKVRRWIISLMQHRLKLYYLIVLIICLLSLFFISF